MQLKIIGFLAVMMVSTMAQAMTVTEFLAKTDAVEAKGMKALFSSDVTLLKTEFAAAAKAWRNQAHRPNACPPTGPLKTNSDDILALLRAVPSAQRAGTSVTAAIVAGLNRRYPCA